MNGSWQTNNSSTDWIFLCKVANPSKAADLTHRYLRQIGGKRTAAMAQELLFKAAIAVRDLIY